MTIKIQTIIAIAYLSVLASAIPVSGNYFPTASEATTDHHTERPVSNDTTLLRNATRTPGGGNDPPQMLRKGDRRSLPTVSKAHHPDEAYPLSESSSDPSSDTFSRNLRHSKNLFGSNDNFHRSDFEFKKHSDKACKKHMGMTDREGDDFFVINGIDRESCETICRYSANCFGWEYKARGRRCAVWCGSPIDEHSVEADACPGADCYIKYHHDDNSRDYNSGPKRKKNKRSSEREKKDTRKKDISGSRNDKSHDIFNIHNNYIDNNFIDDDNDGRDASHPYHQSYHRPHHTPCFNCDIYSYGSRGNYLLGFDCTNNRSGCMPGLLCLPSPLNGSDRWTCQ